VDWPACRHVVCVCVCVCVCPRMYLCAWSCMPVVGLLHGLHPDTYVSTRPFKRGRGETVAVNFLTLESVRFAASDKKKRGVVVGAATVGITGTAAAREKSRNLSRNQGKWKQVDVCSLPDVHGISRHKSCCMSKPTAETHANAAFVRQCCSAVSYSFTRILLFHRTKTLPMYLKKRTPLQYQQWAHLQ
jgi:hypothetical protein